MTFDPDKPIFNTRDLADILGVSTNFIRQQTDCRALHATVNKLLSSGRRLRRYSLNDVRTYDADAAARLARQKSAAA